MAETSTIFGFMKYVSATDILSDFKKTVDSYFVNSLKHLRIKCFNKPMKKLLISLLLIFCIGCTFTFLNETNINISAKSTKETIMIDAGHGGYDVGAESYYGDYEKDINLEIALLVGK